MWYFSWILGLGFALALGIINVMWLESHFAFNAYYERRVKGRFYAAQRNKFRRRPRKPSELPKQTPSE